MISIIHIVCIMYKACQEIGYTNPFHKVSISVADQVQFFRIRIRVTQKRPDPNPDLDPT